MRNSTAVWKRLTDEIPLETIIADFEQTQLPRKTKRRLTRIEHEELCDSYWDTRPETAHDRELFVQATMDWIIYAFLFENGDHFKGRNHEIREASDIESLIDRLDSSSVQMMSDITCKVEMRSVCWWDVQEHFHNLRRKDINRLADDLMDPLIYEAIKRLRANGFLTWHSGFWNLSTTMSEPYIRRLKGRGKVFLAPEPSKLSLEYAA